MPSLSFLLFFALYAGATFPSFGSDESAGLLAAAAVNGVPPPPAQVLAWLLAKAALWIPFGAPAYRVNLAAAALMAATVPLLAGLLERLSPPKEISPFAHQELEQERWRSTARWLTALLWGLSPGPWRCALFLSADTAGLFLTVAAFRAAAAPDGRRFSAAAFLAAFAAVQWPPAVAVLPAVILVRAATDAGERLPAFSGRWLRRAGVALFSAALGAAPALAVIPLSLGAPPLDAGAPDHWDAWLRYAFSRAPFFPPEQALSAREWVPTLAGTMGSLLTFPGALLWGYGLFHLARQRSACLPAALLTALAGPALLLWGRPVPDLSSSAQAAAWGLSALGLSVPFLWGYHRAGVRFPASRTALAVLLPLSLAGRLPLAARDDLSPRNHAENVLKPLPAGALVWNPAAPNALFHARYVEGRREDLRVARRPDAAWARAEYRRRHASKEAPPRTPASFLSRDLFFLDAAREAGPDKVFTDDARRLPDVDPATGLPAGGRYPEDALPAGAAFYFLPDESRRLVAPAAQLSLARIPFWASRMGDPRGAARARIALSQKFDQHGLAREAEEESLAALAHDPSLPDAHQRLGDALLERGDAARAAVHFRRALAAAPGRPSLQARLARAARAAGDRPAAVKAARAALKLDPGMEDVRRALAEMNEEEKMWRGAAEEWKTLMDQRPEERAYVWRLAKAEAAAGRREKAGAALREYMMFPLSEEEKAEAETLEKALK